MKLAKQTFLAALIFFSSSTVYAQTVVGPGPAPSSEASEASSEEKEDEEKVVFSYLDVYSLATYTSEIIPQRCKTEDGTLTEDFMILKEAADKFNQQEQSRLFVLDERRAEGEMVMGVGDEAKSSSGVTAGEVLAEDPSRNGKLQLVSYGDSGQPMLYCANYVGWCEGSTRYIPLEEGDEQRIRQQLSGSGTVAGPGVSVGGGVGGGASSDLQLEGLKAQRNALMREVDNLLGTSLYPDKRGSKNYGLIPNSQEFLQAFLEALEKTNDRIDEGVTLYNEICLPTAENNVKETKKRCKLLSNLVKKIKCADFETKKEKKKCEEDKKKKIEEKNRTCKASKVLPTFVSLLEKHREENTIQEPSKTMMENLKGLEKEMRSVFKTLPKGGWKKSTKSWMDSLVKFRKANYVTCTPFEITETEEGKFEIANDEGKSFAEGLESHFKENLYVAQNKDSVEEPGYLMGFYRGFNYADEYFGGPLIRKDIIEQQTEPFEAYSASLLDRANEYQDQLGKILQLMDDYMERLAMAEEEASDDSSSGGEEGYGSSPGTTGVSSATVSSAGSSGSYGASAGSKTSTGPGPGTGSQVDTSFARGASSTAAGAKGTTQYGSSTPTKFTGGGISGSVASKSAMSKSTKTGKSELIKYAGTQAGISKKFLTLKKNKPVKPFNSLRGSGKRGYTSPIGGIVSGMGVKQAAKITKIKRNTGDGFGGSRGKGQNLAQSGSDATKIGKRTGGKKYVATKLAPYSASGNPGKVASRGSKKKKEAKAASKTDEGFDSIDIEPMEFGHQRSKPAGAEDFTDGINTDRDASIFQMISKRYMTSGYRRLRK